MGDKPRFWTGGGGAGKNGENIMKQETAKKAIGQSAKFLWWSGGWREGVCFAVPVVD